MIVLALLSVFSSIVLGHYIVDELEPGQHTCRFDYDYKMLQKVAKLETDMVEKEKRLIQIEDNMKKLTKQGVNKDNVSAECQGCQDGWTRFGNSCYYFGHEDLAFYDAERFCVNFKGHLVNLETPEENTFIRSYLRELKAPKRWIGMTDELTEGVWKHYPSEKPTSFLAWHPSQPEQGKAANCVAIWESHDYLWVDEPCGNRFKSVCEKPANSRSNAEA